MIMTIIQLGNIKYMKMITPSTIIMMSIIMTVVSKPAHHNCIVITPI